MGTQIAVRLSDEQLELLDAAVAAGRYSSRAEAVRAGVDRLLAEERDRELVERYRRGYGTHPQEDWLGEMGDDLAAELFGRLDREERGGG